MCIRDSCRPAWESVSTQAIVSAVAEGLGVAVLPQLLVERDAREGRVVMLPFREPFCRYLYEMCIRDSRVDTESIKIRFS